MFAKTISSPTDTSKVTIFFEGMDWYIENSQQGVCLEFSTDDYKSLKLLMKEYENGV